MSGLGRDFEEAGSECRDGEGIDLEIRTPQKWRSDAGDAVIKESPLELGDQTGGDDGEGIRVVTELRVK